MKIVVDIDNLLRQMIAEELANGSDRTGFRLEGLRRQIKEASDDCYKGVDEEEMVMDIAGSICGAEWEWIGDECLYYNCEHNNGAVCNEHKSLSRECPLNQALFGGER